MNVQATFCATVVDEWASLGVTHAVVSPGSRSTPLALALVAEPRITVAVHHDERAAAFTALGVGLGTGRPAVLLCTSGTAAAEYLPAVVEASAARVPLLVCTADRPPELQSVGAPQTIDQTHLYGRAVRWFVDPGVADGATSGSWRSLAARALAEATGPRPGPVHLNLPFREPLVGDPGPLPAGRDPGWHVVRRGAPAHAAVLPPGRGVLVAGGGIDDPAGVAALGAALGWPVLADPRSGCRVPGAVAAFDELLRVPSFGEAHRPDIAVRLGEPPASKVLAGWLAGVPHQVAVETTGTWFDPERTAAEVVVGEPGAWCRSATGTPAEAGWLASWHAAEERAQRAIETVLARHAEPTEPAVARAVLAGVPAGSTIVVASSMPVRDLEWYGGCRGDVRVLANRGANGIDGVVSTGVGVALGTGGRVTVLVGDIAFLHDSNALLGLARRPVDLTVVVVDNRGGGIFSFLPQASAVAPERFELLFGTPHDVDLAALATVHGLPVDTVVAQDGVAAALRGSGPRVVVVRTDRAANVAVHDELHAAVAAALSGRDS